MKLYRKLATLIQARRNCIVSSNDEWTARHTEAINAMAKELPGGSGLDAGTSIDIDASAPNKLVLHTSFHHMNDNGMYDGWTEHTITVVPDLAFGFDLRISGRNRNDIKDLLAELFNEALRTEVAD